MAAVTWAETALGATNDDDQQLLAQARQTRPKVRWWWGRRNWQDERVTITSGDGGALDVSAPSTVTVNGAWCYVCEAPIATWSSRYPVTEQALAAIRLHRTNHLQGRLDALPAEERTA